MFQGHPVKDNTDNNLILNIQQGAHEAFAELVKKHSAKFYSLAFRLLNSKEQAEDIVQESFLKFWQKPHDFKLDKGIAFTTWFYRVISNACFNLQKRNSKTMNYSSDESFENFNLVYQGKSIEEILDNNQFQSTLWSFINNLPLRQQLALNLCYYEGMKNKEAAKIMDISVKALESLLMRAKAQLKKDFENFQQKIERNLNNAR